MIGLFFFLISNQKKELEPPRNVLRQQTDEQA
jgi:hypothetical protein